MRSARGCGRRTAGGRRGDHRGNATAAKNQETAASDPAATSRPAAEPPKLSRAELLAAQQQTLATPRRRAGMPARLLFTTMDLLYGRRRTLSKFKMLELIARVPYQSWEQVAYVAVTHVYRDPGFARRVHERIRIPGSARQRAVAPAHPRRTRRPIRTARIPAAVLLGPASHRVRLLPAVLAALRAPPGVELPA